MSFEGVRALKRAALVSPTFRTVYSARLQEENRHGQKNNKLMRRGHDEERDRLKEEVF